MDTIDLSGRPVGAGHPAYVVAEVGFNHEGRVELGLEMIRAAARAGADAVKFQTFTARGLALEKSEHFGLIEGCELSAGDHRALKATADECGVAFFSTPFEPAMVGLLEDTGVDVYKIASMDVTNAPLLREVGATGRPVFVSTGMATLAEIESALEYVAQGGPSPVVLLHCISAYPCPPGDANLRTIVQLRDAFGIPVGYSDHVIDNAVALASIALGACVVEKHFTTDKGLSGPDHAISQDEADLASLVAGIRAIEAGLGRPAADTGRPDRANAAMFRRGLHAVRDLPAGTRLGEDDVKLVRPETSLAPADLPKVLGKKLSRDLEREEAIGWDAF